MCNHEYIMSIVKNVDSCIVHTRTHAVARAYLMCIVYIYLIEYIHLFMFVSFRWNEPKYKCSVERVESHCKLFIFIFLCNTPTNHCFLQYTLYQFTIWYRVSCHFTSVDSWNIANGELKCKIYIPLEGMSLALYFGCGKLQNRWNWKKNWPKN